MCVSFCYPGHHVPEKASPRLTMVTLVPQLLKKFLSLAARLFVAEYRFSLVAVSR